MSKNYHVKRMFIFVIIFGLLFHDLHYLYPENHNHEKLWNTSTFVQGDPYKSSIVVKKHTLYLYIIESSIIKTEFIET